MKTSNNLSISKSELATVVKVVYDRATQVLERPLHLDYTDHSIKHSIRVLNCVDKLVDGVDLKLSDEEKFVLVCAILLHDIGMQTTKFASDGLTYDNVKLLQEIRKNHHLYSEELILESIQLNTNETFYLGLSTTRDFVDSIALVAKYHRKLDLNLVEDEPLGTETIRQRLLCSLIRLGDCLDIDKKRVNIEQLNLTPMPAENKFHWYCHHYVSAIKIEKQKIQVFFKFPEKYKGTDYPNIIAKHIKDEISKHIIEVYPYLDHYGLRLDKEVPCEINYSRAVVHVMPKDLKEYIDLMINKKKHSIDTPLSEAGALLIEKYKKRIHNKYATIKLFDNNVLVNDIFVDLSYERFEFTTSRDTSPKTIYSCKNLICNSKNETERKDSINMVILGLPGSGKSTLLKYLLHEYNKFNQVIPIYIELKSDEDFKRYILNHSDNIESKNIKEYLLKYFAYMVNEECENLYSAVKKGDKELIFFCDGLDEISREEYESFTKAINNICSYHAHRAIVSSREIGFSRNDYEEFNLYSLLDFNNDKQIEFINKYFKAVYKSKVSQLRKKTLIKLLHNKNDTISSFAKSPILLSLLCVTDEIENIENKAQLFKSAIKILLQNRQITDEDSQDRLISFLKEIAVVFFKLDKAESFDKSELEFYAEKFFCQQNDRTCEFLKTKYLDCGLFDENSKDKSYKFSHRTIWEYLVAEGMVDRDKSEIYSRTNMGLWEESIKMYVTLIKKDDVEEVLEGIWKNNKALSLRCMMEFDSFPKEIFDKLYGNLLKRDKLRLIATLRESYTIPSTDYRKRIVNVIRDTLGLIHQAENQAKDCEVIYSYISFLEEFKHQENVFDDLLTDFLDLKRSHDRRKRFEEEFSLNFISIPSGDFEMGRMPTPKNLTKEELDQIIVTDMEEEPVHSVKISSNFFISQTLVTNQMYYNSGFPYADKERLKNNPYSNQNEQPVNKVSWYEAVIFAKWLGCTLPTEAEWEYACIGNEKDKQKYFTFYKEEMVEVLNEVACYSQNSQNKTRPVIPIKNSRTNSFGLLDMLGNLREWCLDWYNDDFYDLCKFYEVKYPNFKEDIEGSEEVSYDSCGNLLKKDHAHSGDIFTFDRNKRCVDPFKKEPGKFEAKSLRGGCFDWNYTNLRPTYRNHNPANNIYKVNGFRLVLKINENSLRHKDVDAEILRKNLDKEIEYSKNLTTIIFDKQKSVYHFEFEKHFIIDSEKPSLLYNAHIYANKFFSVDSQESIDFYKTNKLVWDSLDVHAFILFADNQYSSFTEEVELQIAHRDFDNMIQFDIYYKTIDNEEIILKKGSKVILKYKYTIPIKLWGNYINRYISSNNESMFINLQPNVNEKIYWKIEQSQPENSFSQNYSKDYNSKIINELNGQQIVSIEIKGDNVFDRFRIIWDAEKYFDQKGLNTFDLGE